MVFSRLAQEVVSLTKVDTFYNRKNKSPVQKHQPRDNLTDIVLGLGLWALYCTKKTFLIDTKANLQRNQTNGVFTVASKISVFYET
jgi:hypothetical protein